MMTTNTTIYARSYTRPYARVTYGYQGLFPYSAADLFAIDHYLPDDFTGNAIEYLISEGATWDDTNKILTVPGMQFPIEFVVRG